MNIGNYGHSQFASDGIEYFKCLYITYAGKRIKTAAVRLAIAAFECERNSERLAYRLDVTAYLKGHFLSFYHTWSGEKEEITFRTGIKIFCNTHVIFHCILYFSCFTV